MSPKGDRVAALDQTVRRNGSAIVEQQHQRKDALAESVDAANELFQVGKATYLDVLLAQQQRLQAELDLIGARRDQQIAKVQLYRAVGGGWTKNRSLHNRLHTIPERW